MTNKKKCSNASQGAPRFGGRKLNWEYTWPSMGLWTFHSLIRCGFTSWRASRVNVARKADMVQRQQAKHVVPCKIPLTPL